jgi:hypothetical protein
MDSLVSTSYLLSYRYGISSRSLIATVVDFFTNGEFISRYFVWHFIFCATIFLSFIISVYLGAIIHKEKDDTKIFLIFLYFLYLSCFTAPVAYYVQANFGRVEIFAFLFMLFLITIINKPVIRWFIPLLALLVLATHIILIFFYIPFVIIMLLYEIFKKSKKDKRTILLLIVTVIIILTAFLCYILLYKKSFVFEDAHSFFNYLSTKTDLNFSEYFLHMIMYGELQEHINGWKGRMSFDFSGNISILINIPLVVLFVVFWLKCFFIEAKKIMKFFFLLPVLVLLYNSLAFFMFFDYGRWMIMILNVQFMLVLYLFFLKNETVLSVAKMATLFFKKNGFIVILICLIMIFLGPVNQIGASGRVMRFANSFFQFLQLIH